MMADHKRRRQTDCGRKMVDYRGDEGGYRKGAREISSRETGYTISKLRKTWG